MTSRLILGQWNAICDRCGFEFKSSELKKDWQGLMVCKQDFESRHPQDFVRVNPEKITPPWVRPEAEDEFIQFCSLSDTQGLAGRGSAGCMVAGKIVPGLI